MYPAAIEASANSLILTFCAGAEVLCGAAIANWYQKMLEHRGPGNIIENEEEGVAL